MNKKHTALFGVMLMAMTLTGCVSTSALEVETDTEVEFPKIDDAVVSSNNYKGSRANWSNIAQIEHGMSKDQLYHLIGYPHYHEGLYGVYEWNYIFNYRDQVGDYRQCQFQIRFDKNKTINAMYWSAPECEEKVKQAGLLHTQAVIQDIVQQMPSSPATPTETFALQADALFAFNKSGIKDMLPGGLTKLDELADKLKDYQSQGKVKAHIIGHTDRLGSKEYNLALSKSRADTVATYLLSKGIASDILNTTGAGEYMPIKDCSINGTKKQQIRCLQPNRRVEVQIYVEQ
ncbi:OmpA family protein [Moraxella sp. ZY200743]|uniref:OmpA family protein n=1 Tax=Moraxella sp. ZY200743 TaxID=2911970 RepID=UPI003D7C566B